MGVFTLLATTSASSEYKGPIITSLAFKLFSERIAFILALFLPVSKTFKSTWIPCFLIESIAISAPK